MPSKLSLSVAIGDYDRVRPLMDRSVLIDGVDPVFLSLEPEEIFFRAFRNVEFDACELSLSSFAVKQASGDNPYIGIPVFPSRMFRHTAFYVRSDAGIAKPEDLKGKRVGLPEYQLTACVWGRILLEDHGVQPADISWVRGGQEEAGRKEKIALDLPADVLLEDAPEDRTLSDMLDAGEIDALLSPRAPAAFERSEPHLRWLFSDPVAAATGYYRRTGIFPIMHVLGVRRTLVDDHPWLPFALLKAFTLAKNHAVAMLSETAAARVSLPFLEESARAAASLMGPDYWSYGLDANRHVLDTFLRHHHAQGLSRRHLSADELFYPATRDRFRI